MAGGRKLRVSCGPVATFNPSKQEAKGGSDEAQDSIVLSMSNELLYLVPELHTHTEVLVFKLPLYSCIRVGSCPPRLGIPLTRRSDRAKRGGWPDRAALPAPYAPSELGVRQSPHGAERLGETHVYV